MYAYKKKIKKKVYVIAVLSVALAALSVGGFFLHAPERDVVPVLKEEAPVISLEEAKTCIAPFEVDAVIVKEFFDGTDHEVEDYTNLEGVYRPNQGIDYAYEGKSFAVLNMMDGTVIEVKEDPLFGNSITIESEHVKITYQSLDELSYKVGDFIERGKTIGNASTNTYNPELGNHVHIVCMVENTLVNPKNIIGKTLEEIQ